MEGVQSFGHSWSAISAQIPGRPPLTCRNRWRVVSKKSRAAASEEGSACRKATSITESDSAMSHSVSNNATAAQSAEFSSGTAVVPTNRASATLEIDSHPFSSSCSALVDEVVGTDAMLGDPSQGLDSLMEELCKSQHTSAMLPHLLDNVGLPRSSPGPSTIPSQSSHESALPDDNAFDLERSAERQAELEAETAEHRHDTGSTQIVAEDAACSDRSRTQLDWYLEHSNSLEGNLMALPLTNLPFESTRRSQEIHHHHHHHYHHHHYHHHHHSHHYST